MNTPAMSAGTTQFLTVAQTARILAVHASTVRRWIQSGRLPAYRVGDKGVRVVLADVLELATPLERSVEAEGDVSAAERLGIRPLTLAEQHKAFAALDAARTFRETLREQYSDATPQAWELLNEARDERTDELQHATDP